MSFLKRLFNPPPGPEARRQFVFKHFGFTSYFSGSALFDGWAYATWRGVKNNKSEVMTFLDFASRFGDPIALCSLGEFYRKGEVVAVDLDKAEALLTLAYEQGDLPALARLNVVAAAKSCPQSRLDELTALLDTEMPRARGYRDAVEFSVGNKTYLDEHEAILHRLALAGDMDAQFQLAQRWHSGRKSWPQPHNLDAGFRAEVPLTATQVMVTDAPHNLDAGARAKAVHFHAESAAIQGSARAQWLLVDILSYENASAEVKQTWKHGQMAMNDWVAVASKSSLMWAILASWNNFQENTPESVAAISAADTYVKLMEEHGDAELVKQANRAARTEVEYAQPLITRCARTAKLLLNENGGVFPSNWAELVETPIQAPQINW